MTSSKPSVPWINSSIKRTLRKKRKLYDKARRTGDFHLWDKFKDLRRKTDRQMRKLHREHVRDIGNSLQSNNTKPFWNYVKSLRRDVFGVSPLSTAGRIVSSAKEKAEALNSQFCSVFTRENLTTIPDLGSSKVPDMPDLKITSAGVKKLPNLNVSKASASDNIPARILKECASSAAPILQKIYQKSISSGSLPQDWLNASVSPIFKKGDRSLPSNYRPVSLTCIACKQLEHIIHSNIMDHMDKYNLLCDRQHGFRSGRSCETQLSGLVNDLAMILDRKGRADLCIMDFSKAFDMVPHQRLLTKIDHLGIRGNTKAWIKSFLTLRQQNVIIDGQSSTSSPVTSGVPQGTVLGPLLFLSYINDLPDCVSSNVRLFADDLILYRTIDNPETDCSKLQTDIDSLTSWEKTWQMKFNTSKCFIMHVTHQRNFTRHDYHMNGTVLEKVNHHPYLGVELSSDLSWAKHITQSVSKANSILGLLRRNLWNCTQNTKEIAYKTLVRPRLEYCSPIWDPYQKVYQEKIEKVQRRAARFVTNDHRRTSSVKQMLDSLDWEPLQDRREKARLISLYKEVHHLTPSNIDHLKLNPQMKYNTRQSHDLNLAITHTNKNCYKYSLYPRTIPTWNSLPDSTKSAPDVENFKILINGSLEKSKTN